jgi:hypothetical protein
LSNRGGMASRPCGSLNLSKKIIIVSFNRRTS